MKIFISQSKAIIKSYKDKLIAQVYKYSLLQETSSLEGIKKNIAIILARKNSKRIH